MALGQGDYKETPTVFSQNAGSQIALRMLYCPHYGEIAVQQRRGPEHQ